MITQAVLDDARALKQAYAAGRDWASNLQPGDTFLGCMPEATGRYESTEERILFVESAWERLKSCTRLSTDENRKIISITWKTPPREGNQCGKE